MPIQGTWVWSLVQENPTYLGAALCCKAHVLHILKPTHPRVHAPQQEEPQQWEAHTLQLENSPYLPQLEKASTATKTQQR